MPQGTRSARTTQLIVPSACLRSRKEGSMGTRGQPVSQLRAHDSPGRRRLGVSSLGVPGDGAARRALRAR